MPPIERINPVYRDALLAARLAGFRINRASEERILLAYAEMIARIVADMAAGEITQARAAALRNEIVRALDEFRRAANQATADGIRYTADTVVDIHRRTNERLIREYAAGTAGIVADFDRVPARAFAAMVARSQNAATFRTLINRRITNVVPQVDVFLDAAVGRGVAASRGAVDLARILANDDERLIRLLDRMPGLGSGFRRDLQAGVGQIDFEAYGIAPEDVADLKRLLYDARRIQISETNNSLRESNAESLRESPIVMGSTWQRSGRHVEGSCECDVLATADFYGMGPGVYPYGKFPVAPHPLCACSAGSVVFRPPSEWNTAKPPPAALSADPGAARFYARYATGWTERRLETVQTRVRGVIAEVEGKAGPAARRAA